MEQESIDTTLGDLIAVLTEEAARLVHNDKDAYKVVAFILTDLLRNSSPTQRSWH